MRSLLLELAWDLPRTVASIAPIRHLVDTALAGLGVTGACRYDIVLALDEACANAVEHADDGAGYRVTVDADATVCAVAVIDAGIGLVAVPPARPGARGRGLMIIQACTDTFELDPVVPSGLALRFTKKLAWDAGFPPGDGIIDGDENGPRRGAWHHR